MLEFERRVNPAGPNKSLIYFFFALQLFGLVGCVAILLTVFLSRNVQRHPTWVNFYCSWIISALSYCLILFAGQETGKEPDHALCLTQAALVYGAPALTACTTLTLVIHIWFTLRSVLARSEKKARRLWTISVLVLPYVSFVLMFVGALSVGLQDPATVGRIGSGMYCNMANRIPSKTSAIFVAAVMVVTVSIEVAICNTLYRNWYSFKRGQNSLSMAFRLLGFSVFGVLSIGLGLEFFASQKHGAALNIVIAIMPVAAVLVCGTQIDLLRAWMFWRTPKAPEVPPKELLSDPAFRV